jgi:hypothetical protein
MLAISLVPGFWLAIVNLARIPPSDTPLWENLAWELTFALTLAVTTNAAWRLVKRQPLALAFSIYALVMIAWFVLAAILVSNGGVG